MFLRHKTRPFDPSPSWRTAMQSFPRAKKPVCAMLLALLLTGCQQPPSWQTRNIQGLMPDLAFQMRDENGDSVTAANYLKQNILLFFGYTHCPHICPTTLARLGVLMHKLGPAAADFSILFVSMDPERDTPAVLKQYTAAFAPNIIGLAGNAAQTAAIAKRYRVAFGHEKPDANGDYAVFHSNAVYVFDTTGKARLLFTSSNTPEQLLADLRQLHDA